MFRKMMLAIVILSFIPAIPTTAQEAQTAVVCNSSSINVRTEPRIDSPSLGMIPDKTPLIVLERDVPSRSGDFWTHIQVIDSDLMGWVFQGYITFLPRYGEISTDTLNVRTAPSYFADILAQFHLGDPIELLGREKIYGNGGEWLYVRQRETNLTGWIIAGYINTPSYRTACHLPILAEATPENPLPTMIWGSQPVNVYADDDVESDVILELPNGARLEVISAYEVNFDNNKYWFQVRVNDVIGWIFSDSAAYDALLYLPIKVDVVASNLNIRAEPPNGAIIGKLAAGTRVTVTNSRSINGDAWFYIEPEKGWINADYVEPLPIVQ